MAQFWQEPPCRPPDKIEQDDALYIQQLLDGIAEQPWQIQGEQGITLEQMRALKDALDPTSSPAD